MLGQRRRLEAKERRIGRKIAYGVVGIREGDQIAVLDRREIAAVDPRRECGILQGAAIALAFATQEPE